MTELRPEDRPDSTRPDYGLEDEAASLRLDAVVRRVAAAVEAGEVERNEAVVALADGVQEIAQTTRDVSDITTREAVLAELDPVFTAAGFEKLTPFEF